MRPVHPPNARPCGAPVRRRALAAIGVLPAALGTILSVAGCGDRTLTLVTVTGVPAEATLVRAGLSLDGKQATAPEDFQADGDQVRFGLRLPGSLSGTLQISVDALLPQGCRSATGGGSVAISGGGGPDLSIDLMHLQNHQCPVRVSVTGDGQLRSATPMQPSTEWLDAGVPETLMPIAGPTSYLQGFSGDPACIAAGPCTLTLSGPSSLTATFQRWECSAQGFCRQDPVPVGAPDAGVGIWGPQKDEVWLSTSHSFRRYNGTYWETLPAAPADLLWWLAGTGSSDVWSVGAGGAVAHWDGMKWMSVPGVQGDLYGLWVPGPGKRVYVAGENGVWSVGAGAPPQNEFSNGSYFSAVWGMGGTRVAVGASNTVLVASDQNPAWQALPHNNPVDASLIDVWGSSPTDIWTVGEAGTILHCDGQSCSVVPNPDSNNLIGLWGTGPHDIWAAGENSTVLHYDGQAWQVVDIGFHDKLYTFNQVWDSGPGDVWLAGDIVLRRNPALVPGAPMPPPVNTSAVPGPRAPVHSPTGERLRPWFPATKVRLP